MPRDFDVCMYRAPLTNCMYQRNDPYNKTNKVPILVYLIYCIVSRIIIILLICSYFIIVIINDCIHQANCDEA